MLFYFSLFGSLFEFWGVRFVEMFESVWDGLRRFETVWGHFEAVWGRFEAGWGGLRSFWDGLRPFWGALSPCWGVFFAILAATFRHKRIPAIDIQEVGTKNHYAQFLYAEMFCEYAPLVGAGPLRVLFSMQSMSFFFDFGYSPTAAVDMGLILGSTLVQLVYEVAVDLICVSVELRFSIDVERAWRNRYSGFWLCACLAALLTFQLFFHAFEVRPTCADGQLFCQSCMGPEPYSLHQAYCADRAGQDGTGTTTFPAAPAPWQLRVWRSLTQAISCAKISEEDLPEKICEKKQHGAWRTTTDLVHTCFSRSAKTRICMITQITQILSLNIRMPLLEW